MNLDGFTGEKIVIRPSSVDNFFTCGRQWALVHIGGVKTIPGARAAIGTAIHQSAEVCWSDAIPKGVVDTNLTKLNDAAIDNFQEAEKKEPLNYDSGENTKTAEKTILEGVKTFMEDIVPYVDIPIYTEQRFTVDIDHPIVKAVSGTVDYISHNTLSDLKTSKKKPAVAGHVTQQSIYKWLAEENGHATKYSTIQGIALTKNPLGHILPLEPNIPRAKYLINKMLDVMEAFHNGVDPELLFHGNNKHYLCSPKYCSLFNTCPYVQGE